MNIHVRLITNNFNGARDVHPRYPSADKEIHRGVTPGWSGLGSVGTVPDWTRANWVSELLMFRSQIVRVSLHGLARPYYLQVDSGSMGRPGSVTMPGILVQNVIKVNPKTDAY